MKNTWLRPLKDDYNETAPAELTAELFLFITNVRSNCQPLFLANNHHPIYV